MIIASRNWYALKKLIPATLHEPLLDIYYGLRATGLKGNDVQCPVCGSSFRSFIKGHICPRCGSGQRHRLLYLFLQQRTDFFTRPHRVLHFAPEHCFYKRLKEIPGIDYISGDLNSPRAMLKIDMTSIQFPDNHFDVVISSHVLEHIPDDAAAMQELVRVVKPGGWSIHQAPIDYSREKSYEDDSITTDEGRLNHFGHIDHKRIYGRDYKERLKAAGFHVTEDLFVQGFSLADQQRLGLDAKERIYFCRKLLHTGEPALSSVDQHSDELVENAERPTY